MAHDRLELLFVCHANLCRSAMAERLTNRAFADRLGAYGARLTVASAGTHARAGLAMHETAARVLRERRAYPGGFASRLVTPPILAAPDLILTATRAQRSACVSMMPGAVRHTFTLRQFGRLATSLGSMGGWSPPPGGGLPPGRTAIARADSPARRLHALLDEIASVRSRLQPVPAVDDDLPDPVRGPIEDFRMCADEIQRCIDALVDVIVFP